MTVRVKKHRQSDREWAITRSAGHCWLCGVLIHELLSRISTRLADDFVRGFVVTRYDQSLPSVRENLIAICKSCSSARGQFPTLIEHRYLRMRQQFDPPLTTHDVHLLATFGSKVHFLYHYFWFETEAARAIIQSVEHRFSANYGRSTAPDIVSEHLPS